MQNSVSGAAQCNHDRDRILERFTRHDIERFDIFAYQIHHSRAGPLTVGYFLAGNRLLSRTVPQAHAQGFNCRRHGIGGVHAATGAWPGYRGLFDLKQFLIGHFATRLRANGFENGHNISSFCAGLDRAAIDKYSRPV